MFPAAHLKESVDMLKAFSSFHNEYAGQNVVRFHAPVSLAITAAATAHGWDFSVTHTN